MQSKILLDIRIVVNYLNFVFHIEVKTKSKYKTLNSAFQFMYQIHEMTLGVHGFGAILLTVVKET